MALLGEGGVAAATIDAVAARAGVSRPTIYRRFRDREALIEWSVEQLVADDVPTPEKTGDAERDIVAMLESTIYMLTKTPLGPVLRAVIPELPHSPALGAFANAIGARRRRALKETLVQAIEASYLSPDTDLDALIDGLTGAIYFRYLMTQRPINRRYALTLLRELTR
ncbi:MAG: TetR/AcrR family transcriptional regulator C-terminal ligand-binding domain-containing protein [Pseudomonadota bacterium]